MINSFESRRGGPQSRPQLGYQLSLALTLEPQARLLRYLQPPLNQPKSCACFTSLKFWISTS